jgi:hypothetical protein
MFRLLHGVIMRLSVLLALAFIALQNPAPSPRKIGQPQQKQSTAANQTTVSDRCGTEQSPLVVKTVPAAKTKQEADQDANDRKEKSANDRHIVYLTAALAAIAFGQLCVYWYQATKLKETVESYEAQSQSMERHIDEAARSADAMETIANTIQTGNRAIIRVYLTVTIGSAIYQERRVGQGDLKFEARPHLVNTGNTPARKVRILQRKAAILTNPVPADFAYPLPDDDPNQGDAVVGAHLTYIMNCVVDDFVPDADVQAIKEGAGHGLFVWGIVSYEDIFGEPHTTKFGQHLYWLPNGTVMGFYIPGKNDAD